MARSSRVWCVCVGRRQAGRQASKQAGSNSHHKKKKNCIILIALRKRENLFYWWCNESVKFNLRLLNPYFTHFCCRYKYGHMQMWSRESESEEPGRRCWIYLCSRLSNSRIYYFFIDVRLFPYKQQNIHCWFYSFKLLLQRSDGYFILLFLKSDYIEVIVKAIKIVIKQFHEKSFATKYIRERHQSFI